MQKIWQKETEGMGSEVISDIKDMVIVFLIFTGSMILISIINKPKRR